MEKKQGSIVILADDVLTALRYWHGAENASWPLAHLRLGGQLYHEQKSFQAFQELGGAANNRAILSRGLAQLRHISPDAEDLLRERFEHRRDVLTVANRLNISESSLFYRQRQAINKLTDILNELESVAAADWRERMRDRLLLPTYIELVGVEKISEQLLQTLLNEENFFIVSLDGIGGIGKTALADFVTRQAIETSRFDEIAWVTAKHTHLSMLGRLQVESGRPALTLHMLIEQLSQQLALQIDGQDTKLAQQRAVQHYLRKRRCLVVIDNLETVADLQELIPAIQKMQKPTKFLLTSRLRLLDRPGIYSSSLRELDLEAAIKLVQIEARRAGFGDFASATREDLQTIYETVGGNPLALKLVVGQLRFYSLATVLQRLGEKPQEKQADGLFEYLFTEIWESLNDECKQILLALTQAGESGFTLSHIVDITSLAQPLVGENLEKLVLLSLLDLSGSFLDRRYRLHRITELFLLSYFEES